MRAVPGALCAAPTQRRAALDARRSHHTRLHDERVVGVQDMRAQRFPPGQAVHASVLNPKCVTLGELYGQYNELTGEWRDGLVSCWRGEAGARLEGSAAAAAPGGCLQLGLARRRAARCWSRHTNGVTLPSWVDGRYNSGALFRAPNCRLLPCVWLGAGKRSDPCGCGGRDRRQEVGCV